ncbi:hypothetical protein [Phytopseudomonas flavescens]|uniref:hypothetical protein n=1 Tax=Phytopseudomonas flavescens TaxID=29435 RepID=UPI001113F675|nr:hypothetical protein [Pseudomonas flavescens]
MELSNLLKEWLLRVLGKRLISVSGLFYIFEEERVYPAQRLCFYFEESHMGSVGCAIDGMSLDFSLTAMVNVDLGEYGREEVFPILTEELFGVVGKKLISAYLVRSSASETFSGISLVFEEGGVSILNLGDELYVDKIISPEIIVSEGLKFIAVA